jgi:hypothetical protein
MKYPPRRAATCGCGYLAAFLTLLLVASLQIQYHHLKVPSFSASLVIFDASLSVYV